MANRKQRLAAKANPSSRIESLEAENQSLRDALFSVLKQMGRIRVEKRVANGLEIGDGMNVKDLGDAWLFEFQPAAQQPDNMVTRNGVTNGQPNKAPEAS